MHSEPREGASDSLAAEDAQGARLEDAGWAGFDESIGAAAGPPPLGVDDGDGVFDNPFGARAQHGAGGEDGLLGEMPDPFTELLSASPPIPPSSVTDGDAPPHAGEDASGASSADDVEREAQRAADTVSDRSGRRGEAAFAWVMRSGIGLGRAVADEAEAVGNRSDDDVAEQGGAREDVPFAVDGDGEREKSSGRLVGLRADGDDDKPLTAAWPNDRDAGLYARDANEMSPSAEWAGDGVASAGGEGGEGGDSGASRADDRAGSAEAPDSGDGNMRRAANGAHRADGAAHTLSLIHI